MAYGSLAHRANIQMNPMNTNILIAERAPTFAYQHIQSQAHSRTEIWTKTEHTHTHIWMAIHIYSCRGISDRLFTCTIYESAFCLEFSTLLLFYKTDKLSGIDFIQMLYYKERAHTLTHPFQRRSRVKCVRAVLCIYVCVWKLFGKMWHCLTFFIVLSCYCVFEASIRHPLKCV